MNLTVITLWLKVLVLGMALLQLSLTLGAPFGEYALGGMNKVLPTKMRFISIFFCCLFTVTGLSYMQKSGILNLFFNSTFINVLLIIYTIFLACAIVSNGFITKSKKEKYVMTPLSIIGFLSSFYFLLNH